MSAQNTNKNKNITTPVGASIARPFRENKGITIISLVITVIIMLILAGVALSLTIGERGIFETAQSTKDIQKIAEYKDNVEISRTGVAVDNLGKVTLDNLIEEIYKDKIVPEGRITPLDSTRAKMVTEEGYVFIITADGIEYIDKKENIPNPEIKEGDLIINTPTWDSNTHKVSVTITKGSNVESSLQIQYQVNSTTETWTNGTNISNLNLNDTVYARLWNGLEGGNYASLKITEKTAPTVTVNITGTSTNSITASATSSDAQAGMPSSPTYTFYIKKTSEEDTAYVQKQSSTSTTCTFTGLTQNTSYTVKVTTKDVAGNSGSGTKAGTTGTVTVASGNITIGAPTWNASTHKASVSITKGSSVASNLSIQYQVNSTTGTWTTGTSVSNLNLNDTVYARLWDGTNGGSYTSLKITEKTAPTVTVNITGTSTNSITASATSSDAQAGMPSNPTYTFYIKKTSEEDTAYVQKQSSTSTTCTFTGLTQNTSYTVKVTTKDVAGNTGIGTLNASTEKQLVTSITLNETTKIIDKGSTYTLVATVSPENANNKNITWSSSNTNVATVSNGVITAKNVGTAIITATSQDGSGKSVSCNISVCGIPNGTRVSVSSGVNAEYAIDGNVSGSEYWNANAYKGTVTLTFPSATQVTKVAIYHNAYGHIWNYRVLNDNSVIGQLNNHSGTNGWTEIDITDGNYTYLNIYGENIGNTCWFALGEIKIYP